MSVSVAKTLMVELDESINRFKKLDFEKWLDNREKTIEKLKEISSILEKVNKGSGIVKTTGGAAQITGGVLTILGLYTLNPALVVWGVGMGTGGGVTSVASSLIKYGWNSYKNNELEQVLNRDKQLTKEICDAFKDLGDKLKQIEKNIHLFKDVSQALWAGYNGFNLVWKSLFFEAIKGSFWEPRLMAMGLADGKLLGLTIYGAATEAARSLESLISGVNVVFGIIDVFSGANDVSSEGESAQKINDIVKQLEESCEELKKKYYDIRKEL